MNNLRSVRRAADRSQLWLMKKSGVHFSVISKIENNWLVPSERQKHKLAKALGREVEEVFPVEKPNEERSN